VDGHFDDYMKWLDTTWKQEEEAAKKAGYIISYEVLTVEPRGPDDPDILLVITSKNWAALDGATAKGDAIAKQIEGSVTAASPAGTRLIDDADSHSQVGPPSPLAKQEAGLARPASCFASLPHGWTASPGVPARSIAVRGLRSSGEILCGW
jgi:hypothetical protein